MTASRNKWSNLRELLNTRQYDNYNLLSPWAKIC